MTVVTRSAILVGVLIVLVFVGSRELVRAAPGDVLITIPRLYGCYGQFGGVGVAFPNPVGANQVNILFSCQNPNSFETAPVVYAKNVASFPETNYVPATNVITDDDGNYLPIEALAWDSDGKGLWAINRIPVGPAGPGVVSGICAVWRLSDQNTLAFGFEDPSGGCDFISGQVNLFDGLAIDAASDTLYLSPANGATIRHLNKDGTPAAHDGIDFAGLTAGICDGLSCGSSGLFVGANGHLVSATGESGKLIEIDPAVPSVIAVYESGAGRDWGIVCGPVFTLPDGSLTNTIISADLYSENMNLLQAPPGLCDAADYAFRNEVLVPATSFSATQGKVAHGVFGGEYIGFGSEAAAAGPMTIGVGINLPEQLVPYRIIAAPGDRCWSPQPPIPGPIPRPGFPLPAPCAEGDAPIPGSDPLEFPPSIGGWACYDNADNDADGLVDSSDPDCRQVISSIRFSRPATGEYESFYRTFAILCYAPGNYNGSITGGAGVPGVFQTNSSNDTGSFNITFDCE